MYCGDVQPYWTALSSEDAERGVLREKGDMLCKGKWHTPVVSLPSDILGRAMPIDPDDVPDLDLAKCFDMTAHFELAFSPEFKRHPPPPDEIEVSG